MNDSAPEPHSMIYAQVEPEHIADVNWIMEGYEHLAMVSTVDGSTGLIKCYLQEKSYTNKRFRSLHLHPILSRYPRHIYI